MEYTAEVTYLGHMYHDTGRSGNSRFVVAYRHHGRVCFAYTKVNATQAVAALNNAKEGDRFIFTVEAVRGRDVITRMTDPLEPPIETCANPDCTEEQLEAAAGQLSLPVDHVEVMA